MDVTTFVARDRARRFAHLLAQASQERRLAYRGDEVGMASLRNEALTLLATAEREIAASVADVLAMKLRDRERGYMDIPFTTMAEGLLDRVSLALRVEQARVAGHVPAAPAEQQVLALLASADRRISAYCAAYDEKRPLSTPRASDLGRLLHAVEDDAAWARTLRPRPGGPAVEPPPPEVSTSAEALDDLLRATRAALPEAPGPWRTRRGRAGEPLALSLGADAADLTELDAPERVARCARVLSFLHPVTVLCRGRAPTLAARPDWGTDPAAPRPSAEPRATQITIRLPDPAAGGNALAAVAGAGADAHLTPDAERAVRALLAAPPMPESGGAPPARTIALLGLLKAFDVELLRVLLPRLARPGLRAAAQALPREDTRKAPVRHDVLAALEATLPGFPANRVEEVLDDVAHGKAGRRRCVPADAVVLLALLGRSLLVGGFKSERALDLTPWSDDDVLATCRDLLDLASVRRVLESGQPADAAQFTRLERSTVALLGRLGRLS